jgi:chromosome partitioning protein
MLVQRWVSRETLAKKRRLESPLQGQAPKQRERVTMSHIIAIANQKGGVGKTTTAVNLGASLAQRGCRTLVIDLDPQGNASTALGVDKSTVGRQIYDVLVNNAPMAEAIYNTSIVGLSVAPTNNSLMGAELELVSAMARETRLRRSLVPIRRDFDLVLIDCPPSLGLLTLNSLTACDSVLVPLQCEYYALEGLSSLLHTVDLVRRSLNPKLRLHGILLTMFDRRNRLSFQVEADAREHFPDQVYKTAIPRNVRLSESPSFGQPVLLYERNCRGAQAYEALADEILEKEQDWVAIHPTTVREVAR